MKIMLDQGAVMPTRAHPYDAGLDLYAPIDIKIPGAKVLGYSAIENAEVVEVGAETIDTGIHVQIPECCVGFIKSKSGLMVNHGITTDGTIDCGYTGSIRVKLFNHSSKEYCVKAGDKIAQLVIVPCVLPPLEVVDSLEKTARGAKGFGSTGK